MKKLNGYEQSRQPLEDTASLKILKDMFRANTTGADDDLGIDVQDAIGREESLSLVADHILVSVEGELVTLEGEVYRDEEKMIAGDLAGILAGEDNVNNYLRVVQHSK